MPRHLPRRCPVRAAAKPPCRALPAARQQPPRGELQALPNSFALPPAATAAGAVPLRPIHWSAAWRLQQLRQQRSQMLLWQGLRSRTEQQWAGPRSRCSAKTAAAAAASTAMAGGPSGRVSPADMQIPQDRAEDPAYHLHGTWFATPYALPYLSQRSRRARPLNCCAGHGSGRGAGTSATRFSVWGAPSWAPRDCGADSRQHPRCLDGIPPVRLPSRSQPHLHKMWAQARSAPGSCGPRMRQQTTSRPTIISGEAARACQTQASQRVKGARARELNYSCVGCFGSEPRNRMHFEESQVCFQLDAHELGWLWGTGGKKMGMGCTMRSRRAAKSLDLTSSEAVAIARPAPLFYSGLCRPRHPDGLLRRTLLWSSRWCGRQNQRGGRGCRRGCRSRSRGRKPDDFCGCAGTAGGLEAAQVQRAWAPELQVGRMLVTHGAARLPSQQLFRVLRDVAPEGRRRAGEKAAVVRAGLVRTRENDFGVGASSAATSCVRSLAADAVCGCAARVLRRFPSPWARMLLPLAARLAGPRHSR